MHTQVFMGIMSEICFKIFLRKKWMYLEGNKNK